MGHVEYKGYFNHNYEICPAWRLTGNDQVLDYLVKFKLFIELT
jgi:hypothetical protein